MLPTTAASTNGSTGPRIGTPLNDTPGWAGWAISSFTNKLGTASGEIQSKAMHPQRPSAGERSSSMPPNTSRVPALSASASPLHREAITSTNTPKPIDPPADQYFSNPIDDDESIDEAWAAMAEDEFVDAPSDLAPGTHLQKSPAQTIAASFDDGGEPDFEGWLKAQAQAKSKGPLPKGLAKPSAQATANVRSAITRTTTTGSVESGVGTKKLLGTATKPKPTTTKAISTKPQDADDDWGDAWN